MKKKGVIKWEDWEFKNVNWKRVLREIVDYAPNGYGRGERGYEEDHPLVKKLKITAYELTMIMAFLEEQGLIEYDKREQRWINLTSKGFDVALQNQNATRTDKISRAAIFLTATIAIATVANVLMGIDDIILKWGVSGVISLGLILMAYLIKRM
jgi:hypothetical protein